MTKTHCYSTQLPIPGHFHPHHCSSLHLARHLECIPWVPMSGHLGMLKTLSQICSQLIWPHCTSDIRLWVATCSHCVAVQSSCRDSSKLCFSWLITASFSILHVDLWSPGVATSAVGHTCAWRHVRPHWLCHPCPPQIHSVQ